MTVTFLSSTSCFSEAPLSCSNFLQTGHWKSSQMSIWGTPGVMPDGEIPNPCALTARVGAGAANLALLE